MKTNSSHKVKFTVLGLTLAGSIGTIANSQQDIQTSLRNSLSCNISVLRDLGWDVKLSKNGETKYQGGDICNEESLETAKSKQLLRLSLSAVESSDDLKSMKQLTDQLIDSKASLCAYKLKVTKAVDETTQTLNENDRFNFGSTEGGNFIRFQSGARGKGWKPREKGFLTSLAGKRKSFEAYKSNSKAIESFLDSRVKAECAVGLQIAEYATAYHVLGAEAFDQIYKNNQVVIGPWNLVNESESFTNGRTMGRAERDPKALDISRIGAKYLVGMSGYIGNVKGEAYLDDPINRGENMMIVSLSMAAQEALLKAGKGLGLIDDIALKAWNIRTTLTASNKEAKVKEIQQVLSHPVMREVKVYIHGLGIQTLSEVYLNLLKANPRTPYEINLYTSNLNQQQFETYLQFRRTQCNKVN